MYCASYSYSDAHSCSRLVSTPGQSLDNLGTCHGYVDLYRRQIKIWKKDTGIDARHVRGKEGPHVRGWECPHVQPGSVRMSEVGNVRMSDVGSARMPEVRSARMSEVGSVRMSEVGSGLRCDLTCVDVCVAPSWT